MIHERTHFKGHTQRFPFVGVFHQRLIARSPIRFDILEEQRPQYAVRLGSGVGARPVDHLLNALQLRGAQLNIAVPDAARSEVVDVAAFEREPRDIFEARRADPSMPFDVPAPITALMTPEEETPGWISADGCVLYFSRFVLETQTDLFVARRGF